MSFTTVTKCTTFLNKETLSSMEEDVIGMMIPMMDGVINNYCGTNLLATDYTDRRYSGSGSDTLDTKLYPINSITSVRIREDISTFTDVTTSVYTMDDTYLYLDQYGDTTSFPAGTHNIYVTFNAGFQEDNMPGELAYAACYLVTTNANKVLREMTGIQEGDFSQITFKMDSIELPVLVKRVLDRYRVVTVY